MSRLVRPQTLRGFRDLLPEEMLLRNEVVDRIRRVYESFGFVPLDTPVLESLPTLIGSGGDEADKQIFHVTEAGAPTPEDGESTVAGAGQAQVASIGGFYAFKRGSAEYLHLEQEVLRCTGRNIDHFQSMYAGSAFEIGD